MPDRYLVIRLGPFANRITKQNKTPFWRPQRGVFVYCSVWLFVAPFVRKPNSATNYMLRTTFSIRYYCRKSNCNKHGEAPLEMSITINGERLFLNLPVKFNPNEFAKKRKPRHIQQVIDQYRIKTNDVITELLSEHIPITANTLREYL